LHPLLSRRLRSLENAAQTRILAFIFSIAAAVTLAGAAAEAEDIVGWQGAKWGMAPPEVAKVLKLRMVPRDLSVVCSTNCEFASAFDIEGYAVGDQHFTVRLFFSKPSERLSGVSMYAKRTPTDPPLMSAYGELEKLLIDKYGPQRETKRTRFSVSTSWYSASGSILLYADSSVPALTISYQGKQTAESGKL
jgi:hypothetical protein